MTAAVFQGDDGGGVNRCIEAGFDIKSLSEILGHANVNITLDRYVHPSFELKRQNMDKLTFP